MAEAHGEPGVAAYLREIADAWNDSVERWTYVSGTDLARQCGVKGYYVRIAAPETSDAASPAGGFVAIKNRPPGQGQEAASRIVSPDALALVRFGLRAPDDPRILDTLRVIDALLKVDTPVGPVMASLQRRRVRRARRRLAIRRDGHGKGMAADHRGEGAL